MDGQGVDGQRLADGLRTCIRELARPEIVEGIVQSRSPGKPVLGIRIPALRAAVRDALKADGGHAAGEAADLLWHGQFHEEELAACMLLRLSGVRITAAMAARWPQALDNWLSVDELGGCLGEALLQDPAMLADLVWLGRSESVWQRRLYIVALIRPIREGLDPAAAPGLVEAMQDNAVMVRKASVWLLSNTVKHRPSAAAQFLRIWPASSPRALTRLLQPATVR